MQKKEIYKNLQGLYDYYNGSPPMESIAESLHLPIDEATIIYQSFLSSEEIHKKSKLIPNIIRSHFQRRKRFKNFDISFIRIVMGIIGIGASVISGYYLTMWVFESQPFLPALFQSVTMTLFMVFSFQVIIALIKRYSKFVQIFPIIIISILWIIVTSYSIGSAIATRYNQYMIIITEKQEKEHYSDKKNQNIVLNILKEQEESLKTDLIDRRRNKEHILSILEQYKNIEQIENNKKQYDELRYRLSIADNEIDKIMNQLEKITNEMKEKTIENKDNMKENITDFYDWVAFIFKSNRDFIQFLYSIFPALFSEIIAPIGISLAIFLKKS